MIFCFAPANPGAAALQGSGRAGWYNGEQTYYTNFSNLAVSNGYAVITARYNATGGDRMYTSTRMSTCGMHSFTPTEMGSQGIRIEARAQLPAGIPSRLFLPLLYQVL